MDFNYFHIPTRIVQGYECYANLSDVPELSKKRAFMVTDRNLLNWGATQNLRRFIENNAYGLIFYEVPNHFGAGLTEEAVKLLQDSRAQVVIGFGDHHVLSIARGLVQKAKTYSKHPVSYIEIPSTACVFPGLMDTYYVVDGVDTLKKPHTDVGSLADWLLLDPSFTEFNRVSDLLMNAVQSLGYAIDALFSRKVSMLGESYALKAIELISQAGYRLPNEPNNIKLKNELMLGSLLASFAIQSSSPGVIAGLSMALENAIICSHAQGAGAIMLSVLEYSLVSNMDKFKKIAQAMQIKEEGDPLVLGRKVLEEFRDLLLHMEIIPLSSYNCSERALELLAKQASRYKFMLDLSRPAGYYELLEIAKHAKTHGFELGAVTPAPKELVSATI